MLLLQRLKSSLTGSNGNGYGSGYGNGNGYGRGYGNENGGGPLLHARQRTWAIQQQGESLIRGLNRRMTGAA
jgi:hypothetical protein